LSPCRTTARKSGGFRPNRLICGSVPVSPSSGWYSFQGLLARSGLVMFQTDPNVNEGRWPEAQAAKASWWLGIRLRSGPCNRPRPPDRVTEQLVRILGDGRFNRHSVREVRADRCRECRSRASAGPKEAIGQANGVFELSIGILDGWI
jgi:hypothetical protein